MIPTNQSNNPTPPATAPLQLLAVDSYGTIFDVKGSLATTLTDRGVPDAAAKARKWLESVQRAMQESNASGTFKPFPALVAAALRELSEEWAAPASFKTEDLAGAWRELVAFADVKPALQQCQDRGIPVWVVTNGDLDGISALLERNELTPLVNGVVTAEAVGRYKPARELYLEVASAAGVSSPVMVMASALPLDIAGAMAAGCRAVYIRREADEPDPQAPSSYSTVAGFQELMELLQPLFARPAAVGDVF